MEASRNDMAEMATARANVYGLLAYVFREEPSETLLAKLREPEFSGALKAIELSLDEMFDGSPPTKLVEDLAVEFTRLFIGPGSHISPHESMHVKARFGEKQALWGKQTVEVKKFMQAAGLKVDDRFGGMPDHLSAEFEFMQKLACEEASAWTEADAEFAGNLLQIQKRFYDEHLSKWVGNFCDRVIEASEHPFYGKFAGLTKGFLEYEGKIMSASVKPADGVGL